MMKRNVNVVKDLYGKELVVINDIYQPAHFSDSES